MKKLTILLSFLFVTSLVFAQAPAYHDPNAKVTVSNEQIKAWGAASQQHANKNVILLDFEGIGNLAPIGNYYNGGIGPNYGVEFTSIALASIDADAGGSGNFANEPTPSTTMFFLDPDPIMNVAAGFSTGFSFYYCFATQMTVSVYDGLNGTGNLLATQTFPANAFNNSCTGDPTGDFCHWDAVGVSFAGTAKSVKFSGGANQGGFDNITFGSTNPNNAIPTLTQWGLIILGFVLLGAGTFYIVKMRG